MGHGHHLELKLRTCHLSRLTKCLRIDLSIHSELTPQGFKGSKADRSLDGYHLTKMGQALFDLLKPFGDWSIQWAQMIDPNKKDYWDAFRQTRKQL